MTQAEFEQLRHDSVHRLMALNKACDDTFQSLAFRWQYDLDAGTLIFFRDDVPYVVASIHAVGSSSKTGKTWMWAWANDSLPSRVKEAVLAVRDFGDAENIGVLTEACSPDNEYLGWEMTAITAKILGSVGAYRCPGENGFLYFVYSQICMADSDGGRELLGDRVACSAHGSGFQTYVCEHLVTKPEQEWFSSEPSETDSWPDAWCGSCNAFFEEQGKWNKKNEGKIKINLLCHYCYEQKRAQATMRRY
jgi:hypothetical protein